MRSKPKTGPIKVLYTHPFYPGVIEKTLGPTFHLQRISSRQQLKKEIPQATALLCQLTDRIDAQLLASAPDLKVVGNYAVGLDNIDLAACQQRKIAVVHTPRVLTRSTAEVALSLLMAAARRLPEGEALCRSQQFKGWKPDLLLGQELKGRNALIVGSGRIGKETGKLFKALGLKVQWLNSKSKETEIQQKLRQAQVLSLHVPLTPQTQHWLSSFRLKLLPPDAIVINTSRGAVIDEAALIRSLQKKEIFAAGLDVYEREPQIPPTLRRLKNVVLLPHLGSATHQARRQMAEVLTQGVKQVLSGKRPWNQVKIRNG